MWTTRARSSFPPYFSAPPPSFGGTGSAQAALYAGTWDPLYGGIFPELGWSASAVFDVPASCLALGNGTYIPVTGPCAGFDAVSATVRFTTAVPEPETYLLMLAGLGAIGLAARKRCRA